VTDGDIWPSGIGTWPLSLRLADLQFRHHQAGSPPYRRFARQGLLRLAVKGLHPLWPADSRAAEEWPTIDPRWPTMAIGHTNHSDKNRERAIFIDKERT